MLELRRCGCCDGWVASYGAWECERPCPIEAAAAVLEAALEEAAMEGTAA